MLVVLVYCLSWREVCYAGEWMAGIPVSQQRLVWRWDELADGQSLQDSDVHDGATLRLVTNMQGGPINTRRGTHSFRPHSLRVLQVRENWKSQGFWVVTGQWKVRGKYSFLEKSGKMKNWCHQMSDFRVKMHQIRFPLGWGAYSTPPDLLAALNIAPYMTCFVAIINLRI